MDSSVDMWIVIALVLASTGLWAGGAIIGACRRAAEQIDQAIMDAIERADEADR